MAKRKSEWFGWVKALLIAFALAFVIRTFFFAPIIVDGPSMLPTLHDRDQMIVNKFKYRISEPDRFDIVVFHASVQKDFIKRIIGLPGEHVQVKDNVLYINGEEVSEPFLREQKEQIKPYQTLTNDFKLEDLPGGYEIIPENHVLVLGDNRGNSTDSRMFGVVSMDQIIGKTSLIYWPFDRKQILHADDPTKK
ncbi:MAG TPA: signal peptidase I [Virgibacillus sp.]|nr:signal peptidase I [Virgibacillus sp.]